MIGMGEAAELRPGMVWTGDGRTNVSILKLLTAEYPEELAEYCGSEEARPGMCPPSRALAMAFPLDSYSGTSSWGV